MICMHNQRLSLILIHFYIFLINCDDVHGWFMHFNDFLLISDIFINFHWVSYIFYGFLKISSGFSLILMHFYEFVDNSISKIELSTIVEEFLDNSISKVEFSTIKFELFRNLWTIQFQKLNCRQFKQFEFSRNLPTIQFQQLNSRQFQQFKLNCRGICRYANSRK